MRKIAMMTALLAAFAAVAEDEAEAAEETSTEAAAEVAEETPAEAPEGASDEAALPAVQTNSAPLKMFTTLPLCRRISGTVSVRKPGGAWEVAEEGRYYPLGSSYRAEKGGSLHLVFGLGSSITLADGAEVGTREEALGKKSRTLVLAHGKVSLKLRDNLPEGAFFVAAPGFTIKNPAGEFVVTYEDKGDGDVATVLCKTGCLGIEGRHFDIPAMRAADEVRIRTSRDHLYTSLSGTSGNYVVNLDQGLCMREEFDDDGKLKTIVEKGTLAWRLSPKTRVVINRSIPAIGERMSVHTMTFDAAGDLKNERAFSEGRAEVNSGELVPQKRFKAEEVAKRTAEITSETDGKAAEEGDSEETAKPEETTSGEEE